MVDDKYLEKINELIGSTKSKEEIKSKREKIYPSSTKWGYKKGIRNEDELSKYLSMSPSEIEDLGTYERGQVLKLASDYMAKGDQRGIYGKGKSAIVGFRLYNSLGLADRTSAKRRLVKALQEDKKLSIKDLEEAKFLLKLAPRRAKELKNIESKILPAVFGVITIAGILFSANSFTGAVVGITGKSSLTLGVGLFLAGILGLFISRGKF